MVACLILAKFGQVNSKQRSKTKRPYTRTHTHAHIARTLFASRSERHWYSFAASNTCKITSFAYSSQTMRSCIVYFVLYAVHGNFKFTLELSTASSSRVSVASSYLLETLLRNENATFEAILDYCTIVDAAPKKSNFRSKRLKAGPATQ